MSDPGEAAMAPRQGRTPMCCRCRNHGQLVPVRGHSGHCAWKECCCPKCDRITDRQRSLAARKQRLRDTRAAAPAPAESGEAAATSSGLESGEAAATSSGLESGEAAATSSGAERGEAASSSSSGTASGDAAQSPSWATYATSAVTVLDYMPSYYEENSGRMSFCWPHTFFYHGIPRGLPAPGFRGSFSPPPFPVRAMWPNLPFPYGGHFQGQGYYPPIPPAMPPRYQPPRYLPGLYHMPIQHAESSRMEPGSSHQSITTGNTKKEAIVLPPFSVLESAEDQRIVSERSDPDQY